MMIANLLNKNLIIDIYYFSQLFFISLYTLIPTHILFIQSSLIYLSLKLKNNIIIKYINENIDILNVFFLINMSFIYLITYNPIIIQKIFIYLFMLFYNIALYNNVIDQYIYSSICLLYLLPTKI